MAKRWDKIQQNVSFYCSYILHGYREKRLNPIPAKRGGGGGKITPPPPPQPKLFKVSQKQFELLA